MYIANHMRILSLSPPPLFLVCVNVCAQHSLPHIPTLARVYTLKDVGLSLSLPHSRSLTPSSPSLAPGKLWHFLFRQYKRSHLRLFVKRHVRPHRCSRARSLYTLCISLFLSLSILLSCARSLSLSHALSLSLSFSCSLSLSLFVLLSLSLSLSFLLSLSLALSLSCSLCLFRSFSLSLSLSLSLYLSCLSQ